MITCADGRVRTCELYVMFLGDNLVVTVNDITDRKRAEEERVRLEGELQQAQKMELVGRLAGGVAHDFNDMLGVMLGHVELALNRPEASDVLRNHLDQIRKAGERSAELISRLLAFARKQAIAPKALRLNEAVSGVMDMVKRLIGEDIALDWRPEPDLWPVRVDPSQIGQILINLCVNARDAISGGGEIVIDTANVDLDAEGCKARLDMEPGEYVRLTVSDNGCGMDELTRAHLFEPFFTTKKQGKGTGLGLAMVYGAVKQNDGFIEVESAPNQGATFSIYLPRHRGDAEETRAKPVPPREEAKAEETVLLVEDDQGGLEVAKLMLAEMGYDVIVAHTPLEALRLAREHVGDIHLLVTDVVMPEMNGHDLAKKIEALYPNIKSLFMSGYTADVIAHHGVLEDGVHFVQKPFHAATLAAKVREALEHR